jgi:HPr kinase/phosphorylase
MDTEVSPQSLFEAYHQQLELSWLTRTQGEALHLTPLKGEADSHSLIGHLNFIHPHCIQVIGLPELEYLQSLKKNTYQDSLKQLFSGDTVLVILAQSLTAPAALLHEAESQGIPVLGSAQSSHRLIADIGYYLRRLLANTLIIHGVFMDVLGIGVLLTGKSAIGKSELALELITRGHRLIADDAAAFARTGPETLQGHCPEALQNFLEVRGLGILNIRALFGDSAVKQSMPLHLVVHLAPIDPATMQQLDRLMGTRRNRRLLDVEVPEVELPVAPGRNLAVLVEAAARNQILYNTGYDAAQDFISRQQRLMQNDLE